MLMNSVQQLIVLKENLIFRWDSKTENFIFIVVPQVEQVPRVKG